MKRRKLFNKVIPLREHYDVDKDGNYYGITNPSKYEMMDKINELVDEINDINTKITIINEKLDIITQRIEQNVK